MSEDVSYLNRVFEYPEDTALRLVYADWLEERRDVHAMIDLALFLERNGYRPDQVQDFIPTPFDIATCMYHTGIDPFTGQEVIVSKGLRDRKTQRALMQFLEPENYFEVRKALEQAGRQDLIGGAAMR